jgi:hypothetical protein
MRKYTPKCAYCGKKLEDTCESPFPIYVVATDEYYCNQGCLDKQALKGTTEDS